jgi:transposase InsO family protein
MCRALGVNRTSFHDWQRRAPSDRALSDAWLTETIKQIHADSDGTYGARRIHAELRLEHGIRVGRKRVERLMRSAGISGVLPRKRRRTTVRLPGLRVPPDLVVKDPGDERELAHEIRTAQGNQQRHGRAIAATDQVGRLPDDRLEESDRVLCHQIERDRTVDIWGPAVTAALRGEHAKPGGQRFQVWAPRARIDTGAPWVKQHDRFAITMLVIPRAHSEQLNIGRHRTHSSGLLVSCRPRVVTELIEPS